MKARFSYANTIFKCDLSKGIDLSVAHEKSLAWNSPDVRTEPVINGDWVGSVDQGAAVNFYNICFSIAFFFEHKYIRYILSNFIY